MKITEFADIIGKELELTRYANQNNRWTCKLDGAEISGETLVFDAHSDYRREYKVPKLSV